MKERSKILGAPTKGDECMKIMMGFTCREKDADVIKKHAKDNHISLSELLRNSVFNYIGIENE